MNDQPNDEFYRKLTERANEAELRAWYTWQMVRTVLFLGAIGFGYVAYIAFKAAV